MDGKNYATRPLWFLNARPTEDGIKEIMENCAVKDGYAGFGILPFDACNLKYLGEEYLRLYGVVLKEAKRLGLKICLYDEWWFPSGAAGGILKKKFPEACAKRLDMEEYFSDGTAFDAEMPKDGKIMATVAVKKDRRVDLSGKAENGRLKWDAPETGYEILCFVLRDSGWDRVNYLSPAAVEKFIACTHEVYYKNFSEYFGNVIDSAFYDEPQFYGAEGRMWTEEFNDAFTAKYGESPAIYYPALYFDIGEETAAARNMLFSVRADLYAKGFPATVQKWCSEKGISLTGHVDQEEVENPCGMTGDLMKSFKYQDIPGIDEVFREGRASAVYKLVSSAAVNWGKKVVMCECFGAMDELDKSAVYRESFDMFTKGVNFLVPHAVWFSAAEKDVIVRPELSYRNAYYGKITAAYNRFCARVQKVLQSGGQVNTVAVLYPIESLQYVYSFNWDGNPYYGGATFDKNDYQRIGQYLSRELNCDYTFLHPETLADCTVKNGKITLKSDVHFQEYGTVILPGMKAVSSKTLAKLGKFVKSGGTLIAFSELPKFAAEKGKNRVVRRLIEELFGRFEIGVAVSEKNFTGGGKCVSLPFSRIGEIKKIIDAADVDTCVKTCVSGLQYIHKRAENDAWYFASLFSDAETTVSVKGEFDLTATEPFTGDKIPLPAVKTDGRTQFTLRLKKETSLLVIGERVKKNKTTR